MVYRRAVERWYVGSTSSSSSDTSSEAEDDLEMEVWASDNTESRRAFKASGRAFRMLIDVH